MMYRLVNPMRGLMGESASPGRVGMSSSWVSDSGGNLPALECSTACTPPTLLTTHHPPESRGGTLMLSRGDKDKHGLSVVNLRCRLRFPDTLRGFC